MDWTPVEQAAKDANGNFQVLVGGSWRPAGQVAKNPQGKYVAMLDDGAPAPPAPPADIPYPIGTPAPPRAAPRSYGLGDYIKGAVETAIDVAAMIPAGLLGVPGGSIGGLIGGLANPVHGENPQQRLKRVEDQAVAGGQRVHLAARGALQSMLGMDEGDPSEAGQAGIDAVGGVMQLAPSIMAAPRGLVGMSPAQPMGVGQLLRPAVGVARAEASLVNDAVNAIPAVAERKARVAQKAALERPEMEGIRAAHDAGYKLTPKAARAGVTARSAETMAGSARLAQELAAHNAENTARLARRDVGLPDDVPATPEATKQIRQEAGQDYSVLRDVGEFTPDAQYTADLDRILSAPKQVAKEFPELLNDPLIKRVEGLKKEGPISTGAAIEVVRELRDQADIAYQAGSKKLGSAYRAAAESVDGAMDRALGKMAEDSKDPALAGAVDRYRAARVRIAKTYLLDDAMDGKPGEVNAKVYSRALKAGAKLTGEALDIANFGKQFGDEGLAAKKGKSGSVGPTFHDIVLGALVHAPSAIVGGTAILARPVARAVLGSEFAQQRMAGSKPLPAKSIPEGPPPEPGLTQGFEDVPQGSAPGPQSPLGDLTPDWQTSPGVGTAVRQEVVPAEGLVRAVDSPQGPARVLPGGYDPRPSRNFSEAGPVRPGQASPAPTRGAVPEDIPAVEGRPDLPDAMVVGAPAEAAATEATGSAMQAPDAALARRTQMAEVERVRAKVAESPEVAKVLDEHAKVIEAKVKADAKRAQQLKDAQALRTAAGYTTDQELAARLRKRAEVLEAPEKVPVGKVTEGAPKDKPEPPVKPVPKAEATEVPVETIVAEDPTIPVGEATEITPDTVEVGNAQRLQPDPVQPEAGAQVVQKDGGSAAGGKEAGKAKADFQVGQTYVDGKGRKAVYQKDGTWKIVKP